MPDSADISPATRVDPDSYPYRLGMAKALLDRLANPEEWANPERDLVDAREFLAREEARAEASRLRVRASLSKYNSLRAEL